MLLLILLGATFAAAKDHSSEYQEGTVSLSTRSGHEIYTFTYTDGKAGDVATRDKFSADSLKMMNLVDGASPVKVMLDDRPTDHSGIYYGMMTCTPKRRLADITAEVKTALNPPAPAAPKLTPEQEAEQAQQRADCLKLAVKNPSITCK